MRVKCKRKNKVDREEEEESKKKQEANLEAARLRETSTSLAAHPQHPA